MDDSRNFNECLNECFDELFERWSSCVGPARLHLLQPLRGELGQPATLDDDRIRWAMEPLSWIIDRAAVAGIPADRWGTTRAFTATGNARFGWNPEPLTPEGERGFSEIDALHLLARDIGAIERAGSRDTVTWSGRVWLGHPARLWRAAARTLTTRGGFFASQCELVLASLLQQRLLSEMDAGVRLCSALIEAVGGEDYLNRVDETGEPRGEVVSELIAVGMQMTRTLGNGLRMFDQNLHREELRPWLDQGGRALAVEALRASVELGEFASQMGAPLEGAWN
ncbi:MAG: hypothetical protein ACRDK3_16760 [Actinomycetota bacterium]